MSKLLVSCLGFLSILPVWGAAPAAKGGQDACIKGRALYSAGDVLKAIASLDKCVDKEPGNRGAWLTLANAQLEAGRFQDASNAFGKADALKPGDKAMLSSYLEALEGAGRTEEQVPVLRSLFASGNSDRKIAERFVLAIEAAGPGKYPLDYQTALEALSQDSEGGGTYGEKLAAIYLQRGMEGKAETLYQKLLRKQPESGEYWAGLARAQSQRDAKAAAESYRKAILYSDQVALRQNYQSALDKLGKAGAGKAPAIASGPAGKDPIPASRPPEPASKPAVVAAKPEAAKKPSALNLKAFEDSIFHAELAKRLADIPKSSPAKAAPSPVSSGPSAAEKEKKSKAEAERLAKAEAEKKFKDRVDSIMRADVEKKAAAEKKLKEEAARLAKVDAEKKAKARDDSLARVEADKQAAKEAEKLSKEAERLAKAAEKKAKEEAEKKAVADKKAKEEAERLAKIEAEKKAKEDAARLAKARGDSLARVAAEKKVAEEKEKKVREEAERLAKIEADKKAKLRADSVVRAEADRKAQAESGRKARLARAISHYQEGRLDSAEAVFRIVLKDEPVPEAFYFAGKVELDRGHWDRAMEDLAKAPADKPDLDGLKGKALKGMGKNREALEHLERQYAKSKDAALLGDLYALKQKAGDRAGAMIYLEKLAEKEPSNEKHQMELAAFYESKGETAKAMDRFAQILIYHPEQPGANLKLGLDGARKGDFARAVPLLERVVAKTPNQAEAWKALAKGYLSLGRKSESWEAHEKALALLPGDLELAKGKLALTRETGKDAELHQAYLDVLKISPGDPDAAMGLAKLLYRDRDFASAEKFFRIACPKSNDKEAWAQYGRTLMELKKTDEAAVALQKAVELGEKGESMRIDLARIHMDKGDLDKAEVLMKDLSRQAPTDPEPLFWQGQIALKRQQNAVAEDFFRKANQLRPDEGRYALGLAKLYRDREEYKQAIPILESIETKLSGDGRMLLGDCLTHVGEKDKALQIYTRLYQKEPSAAALSRRMDVLVQLKKPEKAAEAAQGSPYQDSREVQFSMAKTQMALAESHSLKGDVDKAVSLMKKVLKGNDANAEFHYYLGRAYAAQGKHGKSVSEFNDAQKYRMDYPDALYHKGASLVKMGQTGAAGDCFRELTQHADLGWKARGLYGLALVFEAEGKWEAVEHHLVKSIGTAPQPDAMAYLSRVCLKLGKVPEAEDWAKRALAADAQNEDATLALAEALSARKRYSEALDLAKQALRSKPLSCALLVQSAKLNFQTGQMDASMTNSSGAIQLCPEEPMGYYYAGIVTHGTKKPDEAKRYFKSFKKLGGDIRLLPEEK